MELYHISQDVENLNRCFVPRIPLSTSLNENKTVPRICFSNSVSGCFSAVPGENRSKIIHSGDKFVLYKLNVKKKLCILNRSIITPHELHRRKFVSDAIINGEYWVTVPVFIKGELCEITNFEWSHEVNSELFSPITIYNLAARINPAIKKLKNINITDSALCYRGIINGADKNKLYDVVDTLPYLLEEIEPRAGYTKFSNVKYKVIN